MLSSLSDKNIKIGLYTMAITVIIAVMILRVFVVLNFVRDVIIFATAYPTTYADAHIIKGPNGFRKFHRYPRTTAATNAFVKVKK